MFFRRLVFAAAIGLLLCARVAHAGYFVASGDEPKLKNRSDIKVTSSRRYKHIGWSYIDVAPQSEKQLKALAATQKVKLIPDTTVQLTRLPSDPFTTQQSFIYPGTPNGDIRAAAAWDIMTTATVVVAVIDSGIERTHEDLAANIWVNEVETSGTTGVDDDGNGYIDDYNGWNTHQNNNNVSDTLGHGTRVAGIIGARGQNDMGIAGLCWDVKLMTLRSFEGTTASTSLIVDAFDYILSTRQVRVINASFGDDDFSQPLYDSIKAAGEQGILVVAAAGNNSRNIDQSPFYPASYNLPNLIAVGAVDPDGQLWSGSNYGNTVKVVAPGNFVYSTAIGNAYNFGTGTSYAAPLVSAAAAMLMTQFPLITPEHARMHLHRTSRITNPLLSESLGGGLLDVSAVLSRSVSAAGDWQRYE